ncbi:MAG: histone deacetylase [Bacillota bacterium]
MDEQNRGAGLIYHPDYLVHTQERHPERKERLDHILKTLREEAPPERIRMIEPVPATAEEIALIHDAGYVRSIEDACQRGQQFLDMDTYLVPQSYEVALLAAGGALAGLRAVMNGDCRTVFALIRPPGHHAEKNRAMGFCLFNNIAIAAAAARQEYGLERVAIVDWDVHHGNGTQDSFYEDPAVLYISVHQSPAYPGSGQVRETGRGRGEGYTVNIPLPAGSGDADYGLVFDRIVVPVIDAFKPELLLISAGQDAYYKDPLAGMALTYQGYYEMAEALAAAARRWCGGRVLLCLEGGYHLEGQAGAVLHVLSAIERWGLPLPERSPAREPSAAVRRLADEIMVVQRRYRQL